MMRYIMFVLSSILILTATAMIAALCAFEVCSTDALVNGHAASIWLDVANILGVVGFIAALFFGFRWIGKLADRYNVIPHWIRQAF